MKLLFTHRYFWPDAAPYALMLRTIGEGLADAGHEVHVFASKPSYRSESIKAARSELLGKLSVRRCWVLTENRKNPALRALNVILYATALFFHILRLRPDVVTASTFPPVLAAWWGSLAARLVGARFIYHMMDVHPEVSQYSGGRLGRGLSLRILRWMDNQTLRRASEIVVLSRDMADTIAARGLSDLPLRVINNFSLDDFEGEETPPADLVRNPSKRRVIFAGNLGRFQNLPLLAEGVAACFDEHPELELFFLGDGSALDALKERWGNHSQVKFGPFLPFSQAKPIVADAAVGLVSLAPNIYRVAFPSKVLTYAGLGVPILALVEPESHLARELEVGGIGIAAKASTPEAIAEALTSLLATPPSRESVLTWYKNNADQASIIGQWCDIIEGVNRE